MRAPRKPGGTVAVRWIGAALVAILHASGCVAADVLPAPLFRSDTPIDAVLTLPMRPLRAQKHKHDPGYVNGQWAFRNEAQALVTVNVKARVRGVSRLAVCHNPPILLNFATRELEGTLFDGQDKLKLVTPCRNGDQFEQLVVLEYLAYRLGAVLTENIFRVRPLHLRFVDSEGKDTARSAFAFVIEDEDAVAERIAAARFEGPGVARKELEPAAAAEVEFFQFLIGNNDYSIVKGLRGERCCQNVRIFRKRATGILIPVPYDFDLAGLVSAPYATAPRRLPIHSVRVRYFTGSCLGEPAWRATVAYFNQRRAALVRAVSDLEELSDPHRRSARDYLDAFFEIVNDEGKFRRLVADRCGS